MNTRSFRLAVSALSILATAVSVIALVWIWQWAVTNNTSADGEHQRLLQSTFIVCLLIAASLVAAHLLDREGRTRVWPVVGDAATGAFVAVVSSVTTTMFVMWWFRSHGAVPHGAERAPFEIAYIAAGVLSLALGGLTAFVGPRSRTDAILGVALASLMVVVAWSYLLVGSSELNKCQVKVEFPLHTNSGECSGY